MSISRDILRWIKWRLGCVSEAFGMTQQIRGIGMTSRRTRERLMQRLREKGIADERVLHAMLEVPRHLLVDEGIATHAYEDTPLPIGFGQTISQPYIVARMTEYIMRDAPSKVLEIGTGSGYQTAVLASLVQEVYTVERIENLSTQAQRRLANLGFTNVQFRYGDGSAGWPQHAPYDAILVTAAADRIPPPLLGQLRIGGRMIVPVGNDCQQLISVVRSEDGYATEHLELVNFVPLISDPNSPHCR